MEDGKRSERKAGEGKGAGYGLERMHEVAGNEWRG